MDSLPAEPQEKPKNTGVDCLSLLQGIFPTQESNQGLLHCRWILYQLSYQGSPYDFPNNPCDQQSPQPPRAFPHVTKLRHPMELTKILPLGFGLSLAQEPQSSPPMDSTLIKACAPDREPAPFLDPSLQACHVHLDDKPLFQFLLWSCVLLTILHLGFYLTNVDSIKSQQPPRQIIVGQLRCICGFKKTFSEGSKKQNLNLPQTNNYFPSTPTVLGITRSVGVDLKWRMFTLNANSMPSYIKDLRYFRGVL